MQNGWPNKAAQLKRLTQDSERGIGGQAARHVLRRAAVDPHVLSLHVGDEEDVVIRHHMHPALTGSGEVCAAVLLPSDLRRRVTLGGTLKPGHRPGADGQVHWGLEEGWQLCAEIRDRELSSDSIPSAKI